MKPADITALSPTQAEELIAQLQLAQRLSVGVYHRLLRLFDELGACVGGRFAHWEPAETSRPAMARHAPSGNWAWDYLPLFASVHLYMRCAQADSASLGDQALRITCYLDEGFRRSNRLQHQVHGEPDALSLPIGEATLTLNLWLCRQAGAQPMWALVDEQVQAMRAGHAPSFPGQTSATPAEGTSAEPGQLAWRTVSEQLSHWQLRLPLARLLSEPEAVLAELRQASAQADLLTGAISGAAPADDMIE